MIKRLTGTVIFCLLCAANANAATVSLTGPAEVPQNLPFQVQIWGDFGNEGLLAGGVRVIFDPTLVQLDDITFNLNISPELSCPDEPSCPVDSPGIASIVWGGFVNDLIPEGAPATLMATLTFTAISPGATPFDLVDFSDFTGSWIGAGFVFIATPDFIGTVLDVNVNQCTGGDGDNATLLIQAIDSITCVARVSINVLAGTQVFGPDGDLHLAAPSTGFQSGFEVFEGGRVTVTSADPCEGCPLPPPPTVFVTSQTYDGDLDGLSGGDAKCQTRADAAGLGGTWTAWLSTFQGSSSAITRLSTAGALGPFRRTDGVIVAQDLSDLTDSSLAAPIDLDENGVIRSSQVWTGTSATGTGFGTGFYCNNWNSASSTFFGRVGETTQTDQAWTTSINHSCTTLRSLYCFANTGAP